MVDRFREYVAGAGREPADVPIEARISYGDGDPVRWARELDVWRNRNAAYVSLNTMRSGLTSPDAHIHAIHRFIEVAQRANVTC